MAHDSWCPAARGEAGQGGGEEQLQGLGHPEPQPQAQGAAQLGEEVAPRRLKEVCGGHLHILREVEDNSISFWVVIDELSLSPVGGAGEKAGRSMISSE